jgi:hypothetical protein
MGGAFPKDSSGVRKLSEIGLAESEHALALLCWRRRLAVVLSLLWLGLGLTSLRAQELECSRGPPSLSVSYDRAQPERLEGRFRLTLVRVSYEGDGAESLSELSLRRATPPEREEARREGLGYWPRNVTHVGTWSWSEEYRPFVAEADHAVLYLGCRNCLDGSPRVLRVAAVAEEGFWGLWRDYQTGIGRVFDSAGNRLPDPAGYFCAERVGKPPEP